MNHKSWIVALVMVAMPAAAMAEEAATAKKVNPREVGGWAYGVKGGYVMGTQSGAELANAERDGLLFGHQGIAIGAFGTHYLTQDIALQPEFQIVEKGVDFQNDALSMVQDEGLQYYELQLLGRYNVQVDAMTQAFVLAGPSIGYLVDSKLRDKEDLNKIDLGVWGGLGADFLLGKHLMVVEVRFNQGFTNTISSDKEDLKDAKARNQALSFLLGFTM